MSLREPSLQLNQLSYEVIGCSFRVHNELGPGLLESVYQVCLEKELLNQGMSIAVQPPIPVTYRDEILPAGFRADIIVENALILEIKSIEAINPIHEAQILTYLKLSGTHLGLLINFNVCNLKEGIRRFVMS